MTNETLSPIQKMAADYQKVSARKLRKLMKKGSPTERMMARVEARRRERSSDYDENLSEIRSAGGRLWIGAIV